MGALREAAFLSLVLTLVASVALVPWAFVATARRRDRGWWLETATVLGLTTAAVGAMYVLARAIFLSRLAAWTSATVLLLLPIAIGFAPTEEPAGAHPDGRARARRRLR